jgi:rhamnose utilization protein RhaD (predicted bifunctional aldolase and dehydrogenase)
MSRLIRGVSVVLDESEPIARLVGSPQGQDAALGGPLTPDQIVYCRSLPIWIENPSADLNEAERQLNEARTVYVEEHGFEPWVGLIAGAGMIAFRDSEKLAEVTRSIFVDAATVYQNAARLGGVQALGRRDQQFIEHWEVELYRRSVMSKSASVAGS